MSTTAEYNSAVVLFAYFFLPRSGLAGCEDQIRLLGGCVGGLDHMDKDLARGGRVSMVESCGDGGQRDAGVDHQGGVGDDALVCDVEQGALDTYDEGEVDALPLDATKLLSLHTRLFYFVKG